MKLLLKPTENEMRACSVAQQCYQRYSSERMDDRLAKFQGRVLGIGRHLDELWEN